MDNPQTVHYGSTENIICAFLIWTCYLKVFLQLLSMTPHVYIQDDYEEAKETAFVSSDCVLNVNWWHADAPQQKREFKPFLKKEL